MPIEKLGNFGMPLPKDPVDAKVEVGFIKLKKLTELKLEFIEVY